MDPTVGEDYADFREEVRTWLSEHLVGEFHTHRGVGSPTDDTAWEVRLAWERELSDGNWLGLTWPVEYGGRGAGLAEEIVFEYEYARAAAPARVNTQALELLGPTLLAHGSEEQKRRFLPRILAVEEMWGQGFSEPAPDRTWPRCGPRRSFTAVSGTSTARRCGLRSAIARIGCMYCAAPTPTRLCVTAG